MAGIPPIGSFWGEFYIYAVLLGSFLRGGVVILFIGVLNLLFLCYMGLWVCHGEWGVRRSKVIYGGDRRHLRIFGHWVPCLVMFFFVFLIFI